MKTITCSAAAFFVFCAAGIEFSNWNPDGYGSWGESSRWMDGNPLPTAGDKSVLITGADAFVTDADYTILTNLVRVRFLGTASLDMCFNEDHAGFSLNSVQNYDGAQPYGLLIKSGTGLLVDSTGGARFNLTRYTVTNGTLRIDYSDSNNIVFGVRNPGVLEFNKFYSGNFVPSISGLEGDGVVSNLNSSAQLYFSCSGTRAEPIVFDGVLASGVNPTFRSGCQWFTTTECNYNLNVRIKDGFAGVSRFGAESGTGGSLGSNKNFCTFQGTGGIVYIGNGGESTSKTLTFAADCQSATIDVGANGGVTFAGDWVATKCPRVYPLSLEGSNTVRCIFTGDLTGNATNAAAIVKRGGGTWQFSASARDNIGSVTVEDGTLEYGSMAETGEACSVGKSERLTEPTTGLLANLPSVPWAFRLGTHSTTGVFAYVGSDDVACTSRLFAVRGTGVVRSDTSATLLYDGATSYDAQGGTLVLDGSGSYDYFANVTNGVGPLSVEKRGGGTWTLGRNIDIAGVIVKDGTLRLSASRQYRWYRFTVKQLYGSATYLMLSQFGLFSAEGAQQNLDLDESGSAIGKTYILGGGECGWNHARTYNNERSVVSLFTGSDGVLEVCRGSVTPAPGNPSTWISFTMRVADNADPIRYYGVKSCLGYDNGMRAKEPKEWLLEGSVDGRYWDFLDRKENPVVSKKGKYWYHSDSADFDASNPGFEIAEEAPAKTVRIGSVSLQGGTLATDAPVEVSDLVIDATSGGTMDGFAFADSGTLAVNGFMSGNDATVLPVTFSNCTGLGNVARWSFTLNGAATTNRRVMVSRNKIRIVKLGCVLVYR